MVKLKGPMLASRASGSLADTVTFAKQKGTHYARKHAAPANPQSGLQVSMRAMMTFLSQQWKNLTTGNQATWKDAFPAEEIPNYNAFIKYNLERWNNQLPPSKEYPATESGTVVDILNIVATGKTRHIDLMYALQGNTPTNWSLMFWFHACPPLKPNLDTLIYVDDVHDEQLHYHTLTPLAPGTYDIHIATANQTGKIDWSICGGDSAVVT